MPIPIVGALIGVMGAGIAKTLTVETAKMVAFRIIIYSLITLVLPAILYNVFTRIMSEMINLASSEISSSGLQGTVIQLTGMGGWLGIHLQVPAALAIVLSATGLAFTLRMLGR